MKIAFFNCLLRQVPPQKCGAIEKIMGYLIQHLAEKGHQVTLFSTEGSISGENIELVTAPTPGLEHQQMSDKTRHLLNDRLTNDLGRQLIARQDEFDVIHSHCLGAGLETFTQLGENSFSTIHEFIDQNVVERLTPLKNSNYVSISHTQRLGFPDLNYIGNVYHGVDLKNYPKVTKPEDYFVYIGRISAQKNPHLAIIAAAKLGKKILLLGPYRDKDMEGKYFRTVFQPTLKKYAQYAEWLGEVDEQTVVKIANKALACLLPVSVPESFGLAAIEAMAVGCPVIAFNKGAYVETVVDGVTGYLVKDVDEMVEKMKEVHKLNRHACRWHVQKNFSVKHMVNSYLKIYQSIAKAPRVRKERSVQATSSIVPFI